MLGSPMAKGILGGIAAAGLMSMLTGPHYYSGSLFGPPVMCGFFGGGPMFGGYGFGEGYEEGLEEGFEGTSAEESLEGVTSEAVISKVASREWRYCGVASSLRGAIGEV